MTGPATAEIIPGSPGPERSRNRP